MSGPAPGTIRPYTLVDILNTINDQAVGDVGNAVTSGVAFVVGIVGDFDDPVTVTDVASGSVFASGTTGWDQGLWNAFTWQ